MNGEEIYNKIKDYMIMERKEYFKTITAEERKAYNNYGNKIRVYRLRNKDPKKYREDQQKLMKEKRAKDPIKNKELNIIHNKAYRERKKLTREEAVNIISKAYRNKKKLEADKIELNKKLIAKETANNIIDDIISNRLKKIRIQKRPKKYATDEEWRKAELERVKQYNLRKK